MRQTTFSELRRHAKDYFDAVEEGDVVRVYRNGRPIADIVPIPAAEPAWKRPVARLAVRGGLASQAVIQGRAEGSVKDPAPGSGGRP
ncbi:MAG: type II toxin-antitoxin system Phd/YefM family antitoxin [Thermoleophilia bacterium]|nr:type II toxin-antitoxin system Phd/YefM family antitoxin [Thermoleophilia bacterium]